MPEIVRVRYDDARHADALIALLDAYARDPAGGGEPLSDFARGNLIAALAARPFVFSVLAFDDGTPVGLVNAIEGFSTFACQPLVNVHDVVVLPSHRGRGIAALMFAEVEVIARERNACKLTLEVLDGNAAARALYQRLGFTAYQLDPAMGQAQFLHKWLG
ncbi:MAG: GNAT family N-acetyltransferase [Thiobacillus sp.]|jgi:ribosomal protein S18 acetylase RimI-like enzyme|nr:GNAT family N-acetyltransferase [Thiobacillus sp.]